MEPPNKGHFGANSFVPISEVKNTLKYTHGAATSVLCREVVPRGSTVYKMPGPNMSIIRGSTIIMQLFAPLQVVIDLEVLATIANTREEIRVLRTRHAAIMMSSLQKMTSFYDIPSGAGPPHPPSSRGPHKPQLQVRVVKGR